MLLIKERAEIMKTILTTYPNFQSLPKGVKRMLVAAESHFFDEARVGPGWHGGRGPAHSSWLNENEDRIEHAFALEAACGLRQSVAHALD